jgi:hypothetical protein
VVSFVLARAHRSAAFARRVVCAVVDIRGGRDGSETAAGANGWDPLVSDSALAFRPLDPRKLRIPRLRDANAVPDQWARKDRVAGRTDTSPYL